MRDLRSAPSVILNVGTVQVLSPPHDISPSLEEQLVLELQCWIAVEEVVNVFLGDRGYRFPLYVRRTRRTPPDEV
jgi:hypothetical protein